MTIDGEPLTEAELQRLLQSVDGLVAIKGKWVEIDRDKLGEALDHWKKVERDKRESGLSFYDGMRLLAGVSGKHDEASSAQARSELDRTDRRDRPRRNAAQAPRARIARGTKPPGLRRASVLSANGCELALACHRFRAGGLPGR